MLKTAVGRLRIIGFIEGLSYLLLLGLAMPLKYFADMPMAVTIVGGLHGLLFVLFIIVLGQATFVVRWSGAFAIGAFIASIIPFGTFVLDRKLRDF